MLDEHYLVPREKDNVNNRNMIF